MIVVVFVLFVIFLIRNSYLEKLFFSFSLFFFGKHTPSCRSVSDKVCACLSVAIHSA